MTIKVSTSDISTCILGCVGKPSSGKSTFFNAVTDGKEAKTGNFPFTTIEANEGITHYMLPCACANKGLEDQCRPKHGRCIHGIRHIPVKLLDVAGLIPGASEGAGLGNKFLDDLRQAHVLIHVIDVSGKTNEKGEETVGYDPINDADWLQSEIHQWVFANLYAKWASTVRRHDAAKASIITTLQGQLSGYGATRVMIEKLVSRLQIHNPYSFAAWEEAEVHNLVREFLDIRFPTILVLNKADQGGDTDKNIEKIVKKYGEERCFVSSAGAECFLNAAVKQRLIKYESGSMFYTTHEDEVDGKDLQPLEPKIKKRLERISDMVLFRYGSTGVRAAINAAMALTNTVPVYPVKSLKSFVTDGDANHVFGDVFLVKKGTTIRELAYKISSVMGASFAYAESEEEGRIRQLGEHEIIDKTTIIKYSTQKATHAAASHH